MANAGLPEPLTNRELEILALLPERLSNKEIAHRLGLAPTTVKRHTVNLYGKLGVNKRWDAVLKADALGVLPRPLKFFPCDCTVDRSTPYLHPLVVSLSTQCVLDWWYESDAVRQSF